MPKDRNSLEVHALAAALRELRAQRKHRVISGRVGRVPRAALTKVDRAKVLSKTNRRCHVCGGDISGNKWQADHVLARATGGRHSVDNYLPAHSICNRYRWHFDAEEFQWILKLGVWLRMQIEKENSIGRAAGKEFCNHHGRLTGRRKPPNAKSNKRRMSEPA